MRGTAPRIDAPPFTMLEIPPRPANERQQLRLESGPPLGDDSRLDRPRPFRARSSGAGSLGSGWFRDRAFGTVAGVVGWVLTAAVVTVLVTFALLRQPQIEALWPPSQRLYALLGLH